VFENGVLRRIFGPKRDEVTGDWRKLHNEEVHNLYSSQNQVKEYAMGRACSTNEEKRNANRILMVKPDGKRPLGRPRCRWVDNIKIYLREIGWGGVDWVDLVHDRDHWRALVKTALNRWVP
jgi:hypothetical protein